MKNKPVIAQELIRSFGRVKGRKLRSSQSNLIENFLPKFAIELDKTRWQNEECTNFPPPSPSPLFLEVGFGYGEHLAGMAKQYPDTKFIGCEPFLNGVAKLLQYIDNDKLTNIRILHGDARLLIEKLPNKSVDRLFILFPDPWPKAKHHKKRIISNENLKNFARIIKCGGRLEIATDHVAYSEWIAEHLAASEDFTVNELLEQDGIPEDWIETRYQLKALAEGRKARFFNYVRK